MSDQFESFQLDLADVYVDEPVEKVQAAMRQFDFHSLNTTKDPAFEEVYGALEAEFGPRGEMERREVIEARLDKSVWLQNPLRYIEYRMFSARDKNGKLAGVRDLCACVDLETRCCVVYLAHTLVLPPYRRTGVASMFRAMPVTFAQFALTHAGLSDPGTDVLLAGEMEPVDPRSRDSVIRLLAYARSGFVVIPPAILPYCQPDFRDLQALNVPPRPIPLVAVIRWVKNEHRRILPIHLAEAYVRHLYAIYGLHSRPEDLEEAYEYSMKSLAASGLKNVPLLQLPSGPEELGRVAPLLRSAVLPLFPPSLQGLEPPPAQGPEQELETLLQMWSTSK